ncbi:MAG: DNA polymerase III subunit gamma/tau [Candidatus Levybacteria bacterium]|nr:DNA polymerase III subunit gamma/tau [Candidatus Levybacteria bacterium]
MVFYRKYRPQLVKELDNENVRNTLSAVLSSGSTSHAFLFTGPKGLGKTSTARIVAKALNCEVSQVPQVPRVSRGATKEARGTRDTLDTRSTPKSIEPCNKCSQCISITNGSNIDVLEIDGASNRGIDEIRDLREKIRLAPARATKKVYIIDEVHMLTTEAFNALLKTLEEPPSHAVFILCTTEPQKVPATILSRCFHIQFTLATDEELLRSFKRIVEGEKIAVEEDALLYIATLANGSFRDGAKILEELVLLSNGKKITKELVEEKYKISNIKFQILEMLKFLADKNTKEALKLISELVKQGADTKYFVEQLILELHQMLLAKVGIQKREVEKWEIEDIKKLVELLTKAHGELRCAVLPQLPLELAVIEFCEETQINTDNKADLRESFNQRSSAIKSAPIIVKVQDDNKVELWKKLMDAVKTHNHSIAGVLRGCSLKSYNGKELVIETAYKFHKEKLDETKTKTILEKASEEIAGNKVQVFVLLKV